MGSHLLSELSAEALRDMGNDLFLTGKFQEAIAMYDLAIQKQPAISTYYSNRAMCYIQLQDFCKALLDCKRSIELDKTNVKAYFCAGQAYIGLEQWDDAVTNLVQAHTMAFEQQRNFGDSLSSAIRMAKRKQAEINAQKSDDEGVLLQVYLNELILQDAKRRMTSLLNDSQTNLDADRTASLQTVDQFVHLNPDGTTTFDPDSSNLPSATRDQLKRINTQAQQRIKEVHDLFNQIGQEQQRTQSEIPDYLCDRITFDLMSDPVITPSGITYDRKSIMTHLQTTGQFDPTTRAALTEAQLIPNLCVREVIQKFLQDNPWAEAS